MEYGSDYNYLDLGMLIFVSDVLLVYERIVGKSDKLSVMDSLLFSIMSVVSSMRQLFELVDDLYSENSMEQNKQVLLVVQR